MAEQGQRPLPPTSLTLHLPALTSEQVEAVAAVLDQLNERLWEVYGDALIDLDVHRGPRPDDLDWDYDSPA